VPDPLDTFETGPGKIGASSRKKRRLRQDSGRTENQTRPQSRLTNQTGVQNLQIDGGPEAFFSQGGQLPEVIWTTVMPSSRKMFQRRGP
jgi:hypothetical protein